MEEEEMNYLTHLYLYGYVNLRLDVRNARPAFGPRHEESKP